MTGRDLELRNNWISTERGESVAWHNISWCRSRVTRLIVSTLSPVDSYRSVVNGWNFILECGERTWAEWAARTTICQTIDENVELAIIRNQFEENWRIHWACLIVLATSLIISGLDQLNVRHNKISFHIVFNLILRLRDALDILDC